MISQSYVPLGYQQIDVGSSAGALTVPAGADFAMIRVEAAGVRWRDDGTAPTADVGMLMADTDAPLLYSGALADLQFIAQSGSPVLGVTYYRAAG